MAEWNAAEQQRNRKNKIYPAGGVVVHELPCRICLKAEIISSGVPYVITGK